MQLVSAVKMKKSQQIAKEGMEYRNYLEKILKKVIPYVVDDVSLLLKPVKNASERKLIILISTNKGLCGSFNFSLFKFLVRNFDIKKELFITIGKKGGLFISKFGGEILASFTQTPFTNYTTAIFQTALNEFLNGHVNQIILVYNKFYSTFRIEPKFQILLPAKIEELESNIDVKKTENYLIEPSPKKIINYLIRDFIEEMIKGAILESEAGEHSSRMLAMKNATDNAQEVIYNLTLLRNKIRQEKITLELLDMITAKESIEVINL